MDTRIRALDGTELISIGKMAKASGVCASALRGYEELGLMNQYGIYVHRVGTYRYYRPNDAMKIAQIKSDRVTTRNRKLGRQSSNKNAW